LVPQRDYVIKIDPLTGDNTPILNENGEPLSLSHKMRYDPSIKQTSINIASVAIDGARLIAKMETINGDQVASFDGWLINEDSNAQVPNSEFSASKLSPGGTLQIPMNDIGEGTYRIIVKAMGKDGLILTQSEYEGVVYVPPAKPSGLSVLFGKIVEGLKTNPWILIVIVVLVLGVIGSLLFIAMKKRETGTPVLQGSMEAVIGKQSSNLPINQTVFLEKPAAARPNPVVRPEMPMGMLKVTNTPDPSCRSNTFMIDHVPFVLGRKDGDLNFELDSKVSRKHALIQFDPDSRRYIITDLGSSNGVFLNGVRITKDQPTWLIPGTVIRLGPDTQITFEQS